MRKILVNEIDLLRMSVKWHKEELKNNIIPSETKTVLIERLVVLSSTLTLLNPNLTIPKEDKLGQQLQALEYEIRQFKR